MRMVKHKNPNSCHLNPPNCVSDFLPHNYCVKTSTTNSLEQFICKTHKKSGQVLIVDAAPLLIRSTNPLI